MDLLLDLVVDCRKALLRCCGFGRTSKAFVFIFRILEVGSSNIFFLIVNEQGEKELVTSYLDEGLIL